ncbi:hypothetical protein [Novosphingobium sp. Leaf2]|uniref:hypothetical protein n=1 Tax=Novosphingobium sp. Leaf2 TaxID=1735670 RepID=UPI0007011AED|nr:hypothetical protein [Novosphingobium sp. Leaf2]KQM21927.1 hypothetical protein ASE49_01025 [Novosphingobium sp. Leaf2]
MPTTNPQTTAAKARAAMRRPIPFTFQCTACEVVEHRPTPTLPTGWEIEKVGADIYAFCAGCAIDLPSREPLQ